MNITDFTSRFNGGARKSLFEVIIASPYLSDTSFMVKASGIPASKMGEVEVPYMGRRVYKPGDRTFDDWKVTVFNDEGFTLRAQFEIWSNAINGHQTNVKSDANYRNSIARVNQYSAAGTIIQQYDVTTIWPKTIGPIGLSWEDNDKIETYEVTFAVDYWNWL